MTLTLVPILTRFLEAATTAEKWRQIAPIEKRLEKDMAKAFATQGKQFLDGFAKQRGKFEEALSPEDWLGIWDEVAQQTIQYFLDPIQQAVQMSMTSAAESLTDELEVDYSFSLKNPRAVAYTKEHGVDLVADINSTTRSYLKTVIDEGVENGWSYNKMAARITERFAEFAIGRPQDHIDSRAHLISINECGQAYEHGNEVVVRDLAAAGLKLEKKWSSMGDSKVSPDICAPNERQGWIPADEAFQSGHQRALGHVACRCTTLWRRARGTDE